MKLKILFTTFVTVFLLQNTVAKDTKINFELSRIDGSKFVSNKNFLGKKTILIFFDIDCPPCIRKLNQLRENTPNLDELNIAIINLSARKEAKFMLAEFKLNQKIEILQSPSNPRNFLRKFHNNSGALPYMVLLNKEGDFCLSQSETFTDSDFKNCK